MRNLQWHNESRDCYFLYLTIIVQFWFKNYIYIDFINSMFSFTFDPLAAIFGISGIVGFFFFVSAAKGTSSINTKPKKELD